MRPRWVVAGLGEMCDGTPAAVDGTERDGRGREGSMME